MSMFVIKLYNYTQSIIIFPSYDEGRATEKKAKFHRLRLLQSHTTQASFSVCELLLLVSMHIISLIV